MKSKKMLVIALWLATANAWAANFAAGPPPGNWAKVAALAKDTQIAMSLKRGDKIEGSFVRLEEEQILLNDNGRERQYPKSSIAEISLLKQGSRKKNAAIAGRALFAVGFAAGYAIAPQVADVNEMPAGERAGVGAAFGAVWGGIAAGFAALHRPGVQETVIYKSR
jgi:hypothetical protein